MEEEKISIQKDGNEWCVLWGDDLQSGIAGFGKTISEAIINFSYEILKIFKLQTTYVNEEFQMVIDKKYHNELFSKAEKFDTLKQLLKGILDL